MNEYSNIFHFSEFPSCEIFLTQVIRRRISHQFTELSMETPYLCPAKGSRYGGRKSIETSGIYFCYLTRSFHPHEVVNIFTFSNTLRIKTAKNDRESDSFQGTSQSSLARSFSCRVV